MVFRRAIILACLLILSSTAAFGGQAAMSRYDPQQTGFTSEKLQMPIALKWEYTTTSKYDNNSASPAVVDGTCYFASGDKVFAVDLDTGTLKWKYPAVNNLGGPVKGMPAVYNGKVYFGSGDGNLYCINAETGTFEWAYPTRGSVRCSPIILDGVVYFGSDDNSIYAVQAESGDAAWKQFTARDDFGLGIAIGSGMIVGACMDGIIYGINASSGSMRWPPQRLPMAPTDASPVFADNVAVMAVGMTMKGYTARSGQERWMVNLEAEVAATPAVNGSDIYVPCKDKKIYAYEIKGRQAVKKWTAPADFGNTIVSSPTVAGDMMFVTGNRGVVAAFSCADGSCKWRYTISPSQITTAGADFCDAASSPIIANGALLVLTDDGVLHCFTHDSQDATPPDIINIKPAPGSVISPVPPISISAVLYDMGSGVDFSSATILLDGQSISSKTDPAKATISYETEIATAGKSAKMLSDGVHTITVTAKDYNGNLLTKEWYFIADSSLPPPKRAIPVDNQKKSTKEPPKRTMQPPSRSGRWNRDTQTPPPPPMMPGGGAPKVPTAPDHGVHRSPDAGPDVPQY